MTKVNRVQLFHPCKRVAVLVCGHELDDFSPTPLNRVHRNYMTLRMEAALRRCYPDLAQETREHIKMFRAKFGKIDPASIIKDAQRMYAAHESPDYAHFGPADDLKTYLSNLFDYVHADQFLKRPASHQYDPLHKILAGIEGKGTLSRVAREVNKTLLSLCKQSNPDTLTIIFLTGHGTDMTFGELSYGALLNRLDWIAGKKVIFDFSCHSGALVDWVRESPYSGDYLVISASKSDEESVDFLERRLLDDLIAHILANRPIGEFVCHRYAIRGISSMTPMMHRGFDVVI